MMKKENAKFGIIIWKETDNIGDDIQCYAARQFLPKVDYYIDREKMDQFKSDDGQIVNCIMNGWFLHDKTAFPPSPFINPLPVAMHFTNTEFDKCPTYLSGLGMEWMRKHQPIGLRDDLILKYVEEQKVKHYFSGCMTLTLKKEKGLKKEDYVCFVDVDESVVERVKKEVDCEIKVICHDTISEEIAKQSFEEREKNVKELLATYQKARCVITSRLHCTLPCLAIETPVLLIYNADNQDVVNRIGIYSKMANYLNKNDVIKDVSKIVDYINKPLKNPKEYLKYRKLLTNKCEDFVTKASTEKISDDTFNKFNIDRINDLKMQGRKLYFNFEEFQYQRNYYKSEYEKAVEYYKILENENLELKTMLNNLYDSKRYRYAEKIRKVLRMNGNGKK